MADSKAVKDKKILPQGRWNLVDKKQQDGMAKFSRMGIAKLFLTQVFLGLSTGKIKSIGDLGKLKAIQRVVIKFTKRETGLYNQLLVPIGFPQLIMQTVKGKRVPTFETKVALRKRLGRVWLATRFRDISLSDDAVNKRAEKNLKRHIDFLTQESFFQKVHKQAKQEGMLDRNEIAREFYRDNALEQGINYRSLEMLRTGGIRASDMKLGRMYFFRYKPEDPRNRGEIFDEFPLIFLLQEDADNFEGINFHYLSPKLRFVLLGLIYEYLKDNKLENPNRSKLYAKRFKAKIANNRRFRYAKVIYRQYSPYQIKSKVVLVHPLDWEIAIQVPTERFKTKAGSRIAARKIWYQSQIRSRTV